MSDKAENSGVPEFASLLPDHALSESWLGRDLNQHLQGADNALRTAILARPVGLNSPAKGVTTPVVGDKLDGIVALAQKHGVRRLSLVGSRFPNDFDRRRSDLDSLVGFQTKSPPNHVNSYFGYDSKLHDPCLKKELTPLTPNLCNFRQNAQSCKKLHKSEAL